jgi:hypothetical protein
MPGILALWRLRHNDHKFEASLDYIVISRVAWLHIDIMSQEAPLPSPSHKKSQKNKKERNGSMEVGSYGIGWTYDIEGAHYQSKVGIPQRSPGT